MIAITHILQEIPPCFLFFVCVSIHQESKGKLSQQWVDKTSVVAGLLAVVSAGGPQRSFISKRCFHSNPLSMTLFASPATYAARPYLLRSFMILIKTLSYFAHVVLQAKTVRFTSHYDPWKVLVSLEHVTMQTQTSNVISQHKDDHNCEVEEKWFMVSDVFFLFLQVEIYKLWQVFS